MRKLPFFLLLLFVYTTAKAQLFTKVTDASNPLAHAGGSGSYLGCAWIDYDNDGWLDLFFVTGGLFHNNGGGSFTEVMNSHLRLDAGVGTSWADYDNDGYIDCCIAGGFTRGSVVYHNNGNGTFTKITSVPLNDSTALRAWSCSWGDVDNDGFTDLALVAPVGFLGITDGNKFLKNNTDGTFSRLDTMKIAQGVEPFTVGTWSDYDLDGDIDFFIGTGPAGAVIPDFLYRNQFVETGIPDYFTKITGTILATDPHDGQNWNLIDYDNDGDLDAYVTNYIGLSGGSGMVNNLYRNDGGTYVKMTGADAGPIVTDADVSLANVWGDFDNDGDLDCIVTNDGTKCEFYLNNNDGSFSKETTDYFAHTDLNWWGISAGDYDRDGDLDLYISCILNASGLFNNNASVNGNHWINFTLKGVASNTSAIGAKVRVLANINGNDVWQLREVSAQNSFCSMNALEVHLGLGNAAQIDSVIVEWPSGQVDACGPLDANTFYTITEGNCAEPVVLGIGSPQNINTFIVQPNPSDGNWTLKYSLQMGGKVTLNLCNAEGEIIDTLFKETQSAGDHVLHYSKTNLPAGIYYFTIRCNDDKKTLKVSIAK